MAISRNDVKKSVVAAALVGTVALAGTASAHAAGAKASAPQLWAMARATKSSTLLLVRGTSFPNGAYAVYWDGALACAGVVNGRGYFGALCTVPSVSSVGTHTVSVTANGAALSATVTATPYKS